MPVGHEHRDKHGRLKVTLTLQLPDFPEVFVAGDCAVNMENPLPATAQVAYQQGAIIARNLKALSEGGSLSPAHIGLRGTLLKLGLAESAAEIFDRFEVKGKLGHLIRVATSLELLPTPVHDFKAITEWLVYCLILALEIVSGLTWWTGLKIAFVSFTLLSIEQIGSEIEEPFGQDPNDLPLDVICNTMLRNVEELIRLAPSNASGWRL